MTRNLRRRHLTIWLILVVLMIFGMLHARNHIPVFAGERKTLNSVK